MHGTMPFPALGAKAMVGPRAGAGASGRGGKNIFGSGSLGSAARLGNAAQSWHQLNRISGDVNVCLSEGKDGRCARVPIQ